MTSKISVLITDAAVYPGECPISRIAWVWAGDIVLGFEEPRRF